jgi:dipeptidyl aminopeptidase/acylaminoacyl peptidase
MCGSESWTLSAEKSRGRISAIRAPRFWREWIRSPPSMRRAGTVYYLSRERTPLAPDLIRINLNGGDRRLLTPDRGWHSVSMPNNGGSFIDTFMSLAEPPSKTLRRESVEQVVVLQAPHPAADEHEFVRPEIVQVKAAAGEVLYGRLVRPPASILAASIRRSCSSMADRTRNPFASATPE